LNQMRSSQLDSTEERLYFYDDPDLMECPDVKRIMEVLDLEPNPDEDVTKCMWSWYLGVDRYTYLKMEEEIDAAIRAIGTEEVSKKFPLDKFKSLKESLFGPMRERYDKIMAIPGVYREKLTGTQIQEFILTGKEIPYVSYNI
jgi:hypothetical protein